MWKYVSRRIKDTIGQINCPLHVRVLNNSAEGSEKGDCGSELCSKTRSSDVVEWSDGIWKNLLQCSGTQRTTDDENSKEKTYPEDDKFNVHTTLLEAITWSTAAVGGWYASQLFCLNRRHFGWENKCNFAKVMLVPSREIHRSALSRIAYTAPIQGNINSPTSSIINGFVTSKNGYNVREVNNETDQKIPTEEPKKTETVTDAVNNLVTFLGDIEFKMGVESLAAGRYETAVIHLQSATAHHHPGATFNLGLCYEKGLGVSKNLRRAMEYYRSASTLGHSKAIFNLGVFYAHGLGGLQKDRNAARKCFITAAKLGQVEAIETLQLLPNDKILIDDIKNNLF